MHIPVLLKEVVRELAPHSGEFFIDGTVGEGGHAAAIYERIWPNGIFLGLDLDESRLATAERNIRRSLAGKINGENRLTVKKANYAEVKKIIQEEELPAADGILLDLGFSSFHVDESGRGFSFRKDEPLMMTYDEEERPLFALLPELSERELADIIYAYGGERRARQVARAIKEAEKRERIMTSGQLARIVQEALPRDYERGRIDPATRTFQGLRIYANQELNNLENFLEDLPQIMERGGRAAIISFHSLEDEMIKKKFKELEKEGRAEIKTSRPIETTAEEEADNPRARAAKMRVIKFL